MLDFLLVLGRVPGTNFQITFNEIVIAAIAASCWYFRRQLRNLAIYEYKSLLAYSRQKYWQHKQLKLPTI